MRPNKWAFLGLAAALLGGIKVVIAAPISTLLLVMGVVVYAINRDD